MRAYFFVNNYLSSIQKGIQAAHCLAEMQLRCKHDTDMRDILHNWANQHKTIIVLNGGNCTELSKLTNTIATAWYPRLKLPWAYFNEDESLGYVITCVGIIVPEYIYTQEPSAGLTADELELYNEIWSKTLAQ